MCGRFSLTVDPVQLRALLPGVRIDEDIVERYNIAPTQQVATVLNEPERRLTLAHWGLIPFWAKDPKIGNRLFNARGETVHEKPSFRSSFQRKRCLILADGFYEWRTKAGEKRKTPIYFRLKTGAPFAFAGLWDRWSAGSDADELTSCAIITTAPNELVGMVHDRMPVILPPDRYDFWLTPGAAPAGELRGCLTAYPAAEMEAFEVDPKVGNARNDGPELILPLFDKPLPPPAKSNL